jgi:hypothetical protein
MHQVLYDRPFVRGYDFNRALDASKKSVWIWTAARDEAVFTVVSYADQAKQAPPGLIWPNPLNRIRLSLVVECHPERFLRIKGLDGANHVVETRIDIKDPIFLQRENHELFRRRTPELSSPPP